ncbi:uncharacterized protein LOC100892318 isoform X1 [Strongylocentrotus purpuratus]|uniref:CARD domain-containing protein n=1 Tax=Strongylocentrotus purpuratus TaxID=7668 RepID=A0A7M7HKN4_STRPU|nr:uncharacterized protein LOC100892318 isoform X1 [Strongylocentrotus purpuratus]XP_011667585.1 uncharacterized protein LOC100892318 isoform X1 [Strongylocentrotus purpuratus]|eukprot:XP_011667584.1 PREDICTED: uncharacterized protein LOC100892318 isoform X1 [Strongylocentrotus purpuratus]
MAGGIRDGKGRILKNTDPLFTELAENYPHNNYTSFCNEFGVSFNSAQQIRNENMGNQTAALKQVLNKWLSKGEDVTREKLETALTNAQTGGLASIVKKNFAKYAVEEESAEGDESDVQANNQATASSAGQNMTLTGKTINVTNNFGTGNSEDRMRRTDEPEAGPSQKKKANEKTTSSSAMPMTKQHRQIFEKSAPYLLDDLDTDDVLPLLLRDEVITAADAEKVNKKSTRKEKVDALLDILPRRGDTAYASFLDSLKETPGSVHLYESMKKCEEAFQEQDVPTSQGAEHLPSSDQPSRGGNTQSGSITFNASGSATIQNNTVTGQINNITHN